jgi:hypothetical protein
VPILTPPPRAPRELCPAKSRNVLDKILHPDTRKQATEAEIDEACKGWNAWKNSNDKARR